MKLKINWCSSSFKVLVKTVLIIILTFLFYAGQTPQVFIQNPYEDVNWSKHKQYKANLNSHTMVSNGWENPQSVVENYRKLDYHILAITDLGIVTYPWEKFSFFNASEITFSRISHLVVKPFEGNPIFLKETEFKDVNPSQVGMVAIQGCKLLFKKHEVNSYFNDYCCPGDDIFEAVAAKKGIMIMNQPGQNKFHSKWYVDLFKSYNHLRGMEVFNSVRYGPDIRPLWDSIQTMVASIRPVWGFANDNFISLRDLGKNWNVFILSELTEHEVRRAMEQGNFYFVHAPRGHKDALPPVIESVKVNQRKGIISITATSYDSIVWISDGKIISKGNEFLLDKKRQNDIGYVRAEIYGAGNSIVFTQPFLIK